MTQAALHTHSLARFSREWATTKPPSDGTMQNRAAQKINVQRMAPESANESKIGAKAVTNTAWSSNSHRYTTTQSHGRRMRPYSDMYTRIAGEALFDTESKCKPEHGGTWLGRNIRYRAVRADDNFRLPVNAIASSELG